MPKIEFQKAVSVMTCLNISQEFPDSCENYQQVEDERAFKTFLHRCLICLKSSHRRPLLIPLQKRVGAVKSSPVFTLAFQADGRSPTGMVFCSL